MQHGPLQVPMMGRYWSVVSMCTLAPKTHDGHQKVPQKASLQPPQQGRPQSLRQSVLGGGKSRGENPF